MTPGPTPIKDVTSRVLGRLSGGRKKKEERIKKAWFKAAGERARGHTEPRSLRKGRLVVNVDSSALLYELTVDKKTILDRLKKTKTDIKELSYRIGSVENG